MAGKEKITFKVALLLLPAIALALSAGPGCATRSDFRKPASEPATLLQWSNVLATVALSQVGEFGLQLGNSLFNSIDDIEIFKHKSVANDEFGITARRDIYENHDLLGTWTVVDQFRVRGTSPVLSLNDGGLLAPLAFSFTASAGASMDWTDVRQVSARRYTELESIEEQQNELRKSGWFGGRTDGKTAVNVAASIDSDEHEEAQGLDPEDPDITHLKHDSPWFLFDPSMRPRYSRLLNPVIFPGRMPLTVKRLEKMQNAEIISYAATGTVEVGGTIGWDIIKIPMLNDSLIEAGIRTWLSGQYRITVFKENDRFVRVKLSRRLESGVDAGVNTDTPGKTLFAGVVLFRGKEIETTAGRIRFHVIPFKFTTHNAIARLFDVGYRYDLSTEEGQRAYEHAVLGRFGLSDEMSALQAKDGSRAVERIFERRGTSSEKTRRRGIELGFLYSRTNSRSAEKLDAVVTLPDGEHHVFKAQSQAAKEWHNVLGVSEKLKYTFTVMGDEGTEKNQLYLVAEAMVEDSRSTPAELNRYMAEAERVTGNPDLFPRVPAQIPWNDKKLFLLRYGRSVFWYGLNIPAPQLEKFLALSDERMWAVLEGAFGVTAGLWKTNGARRRYQLLHLPQVLKGLKLTHARRFFRRWKKAAEAVDLKDKVSKIAHLFSERTYAHELMLALQLGLAGEEVDWFVSAQNRAFDRIQASGKHVVNVQRLLALTDKHMGMEGAGGKINGDPEATTTDVILKPLENGKVELTFHLAHDPKGVYFRIGRTTHRKKFKTLDEIVYLNRTHRFKAGMNTLVLDATALEDVLGRDLGRDLKAGEWYTIWMGYTRDQVRWGPASGTQFQMPDSNPANNSR